MTHLATPEHPSTDRPGSSAGYTVRMMAAVLAAITTALALAWFIIAATPAPAHADALCDAMRARFGPGYPCISVPTNTFTPTAPAAPTTTNPGGQSSGGPQVGIDAGPGPGTGNGTPIVPVPGAPTDTSPGTTRAPAATPTAPQIPAGPAQPGQQTAPQATQPPPSTSARPPAPTTTPAPVGTSAPTQKASIPTPVGNSSDQTTQMLWLLGGAAAIVAGATSTRSGGLGRYRAAATANGYPTITSALRTWLPGGGSERARIGNSQYVLINDPTSPKSYVFHEDVPPGGHISVNPDGTATIYDRNGQPVGTIAKPWAYDSLGRPQKTWYTVDNNGNLVQHIDPNPDAFYPILADPTEPPDLPIGMMSGSNATLSDVTGSGTATATPPPPVEQSSIADSPGIAQLPTLSEPADPPEASSLPPVEDSSIADSPGIAQLPTLSQPADPPDSSNLPPVDPSTSNDPAIEALPVLSGTGPAGSRPETIASNGLIWTQVAPDPAIFPDGLPQGQSLWTTTVNNQTITVQTLQNPDGTFTVISNGTANTYNHNGDLIKSFTPDPGQAIAGKDISIAAATLVGGLRGRAFARALSTFADVLPKSKAPLLPKPEMNFTNPSMEVNGNPSEGISEETVTKLTQALGKSLPKLGEQASNITKAIEGTPSTPSLPPPADALAPDPVTSLTMTTGFAINALIKSLRYLLR